MRRGLLTHSASLIFITSLAALAGCTTAQHAEADESFSDQVVSLFVGELTSAEEAEVDRLLFIQFQNDLAACMRRQGFKHIPDDDVSRTRSVARNFFTEDDVASHGYGLVAGWRDLDQITQLSDNDRYVATLDQATQREYFIALEGQESEWGVGGCTEEAQREVYERLGLTEIMARLEGGAYNRVQSSAELAEADQEWRRCVAGLGVQTEAASILEFLGDLYTDFERIDKSDLAAVEQFEQREHELAAVMLPCNRVRNEVLTSLTREAFFDD